MYVQVHHVLDEGVSTINQRNIDGTFNENMVGFT